MRTLSLLLLLIATNPLAAAVTYRWVDADGVHYSDQPHTGAEKIYLGQTQAAASSASLDSSAGNASPGSQSSGSGARRRVEQPFQYSSCAVVQPADDQVLLEVDSVTVAIEVHPAKRSNDHAVLSFDGTEIEAATADQLEFRITPIERGTHSVAVVLRDSNNRAVCKSGLVSFHVRQPSVLAPANPTRHH
jgi:Domain of unknown function (DUF4124)